MSAPSAVAMTTLVSRTAATDPTAARHIVFLKDGTHMQETVEAPRGSEQKFAGAGDVIEKFRKEIGEDLVTELYAEIDKVRKN